MQDQDIETIFKDYGLEEKEAGLYLASLSLGEARMSQLAKRANLKRSTAYLIFKSLEKKGLMGSFKMRSGTHFVPTRPEVLINKTSQNLKNLEEILPRLKALSEKAGEKPRVKYYEGREGYVVAANDSLFSEKETIRHIGALTELYKIIGSDYDSKTYIPNRVKKGISFKALYFASETPKLLEAKKDREELREIRFLPEKYLNKTSSLIYGNKVAIFSTQREMVTVIIESEAIADSERKKFDLIWDFLEEKGSRKQSNT